jgi:hypothetical protein
MTAAAEFTISSDPFANAGYDTGASAVLQLQLASAPALDSARVVFAVVNRSLDAPDLVFSPSTGIPATPTSIVTVTMPSSGVHTYEIRCQVNEGFDSTGRLNRDYTKSRIIAIKTQNLELRKWLPGETTQYDLTGGWVHAQNEAVDAIEGISNGGATPILSWDAATANPTLKQLDGTTNGDTGETLTVQAQNETGTSSTGGALDLRSGTGTAAAGGVTIRVGATTRIQVNATGLGFFGVTPVARPAAYTQTYATASRTIPALDVNDEPDAYTGIDNAQVGSVYAQASELEALRQAYQSLALHHALIVEVLNSVIDDLQALGLAQ